MTDEMNGIEGKFVVAVVTRDHAEVWQAQPGQKAPVTQVVRPDYVGEDRHVRQAQSHHGHFALEGVAEYFDSLASSLRGASDIVVVGHGTGKSDMAASFVEHVRTKAPDVHARIAGTLHENLVALTPGQIIAIAREWKERQTLR